jgi:hypothetical protein
VSRYLSLALLLSLIATPARAQHVEAGVAVAAAHAPDSGHWNPHFVPVIRLAPKKGWGIAGALNWFRADLDRAGLPDGHIRVRPLMGGYGYTWEARGTLTTVSMVVGPAWDTLEAAGQSQHAVSWVARPSASITIPVAPRVSAIGFAGYLWNRPSFSHFPRVDGSHTWSTDAFVLSAGAVVRLF